MWGLQPNRLRMFVVVGNPVFYSLAAYLLLRLMAGWKSDGESTSVGAGKERVRAGGNVQRRWPARGIGQIPNGHEVVSIEQIDPYLVYLAYLVYLDTGLVLVWLSILVTGAPLGVHPMAARAVVSVGDILFYIFAACVVLQVSANVSARWKQP